MAATRPPAPSVPDAAPARLRVLATTDLHGHLLAHDYIKDRATQGGGLAGLAHLIVSARAEAVKSASGVLLLDNGDTFQGTPLATDLAYRRVTANHPIVAALNHLRYDAIGMGNHDLDHGLGYLQAVAAHLDMPYLSSNLSGIDLGPLRQSALVTVSLPQDAPAPLKVGLLSLLPDQTADWHSHHLGKGTSLKAAAPLVTAAAQDLRERGADIVIVLAHMGVGHRDSADAEGQAAFALARTGAMDALILGHTHRRLPSDDYASRPGVDVTTSTVAGVPAIMAGHCGSDLGVMDLTLHHRPETGWRIANHTCQLRPNDGVSPPDPAVLEIARQAHERVKTHLAQPVARTTARLHSYFSLVTPAPTQRLTARTQYGLVREVMKGTPEEDLPVLAAVAALSAGGRGGPGNYVNIPEGPVLRRHVAGLTPFANQTIGIRVTGADLKHWLEHAALIFNRLSLGIVDQPLVNPEIPPFQFDTIFGLQYQIDPSAPPHQRIGQISHAGRSVTDEQMFILASNQFRVAGGGGYRPIPPDRIVACNTTALDEAIIATLRGSDRDPWEPLPPWRFAPLGGVTALIDTEPDAHFCLSDIAHLSPEPCGATPEGFRRLRIKL